MLRRNKRSVNNCPICGVFVCPGYQTRTNIDTASENHECDPKFVKFSEACRDSAMDRDPDEQETRTRPIGARIAEGFEMMDEDYGWEPEDE
jgi:hypothetical protein